MSSAEPVHSPRFLNEFVGYFHFDRQKPDAELKVECDKGRIQYIRQRDAGIYMAVLHERGRVPVADTIDRATTSLDVFIGNPMMAEQSLYRDIVGERELVRAEIFAFQVGVGFYRRVFRDGRLQDVWLQVGFSDRMGGGAMLPGHRRSDNPTCAQRYSPRRQPVPLTVRVNR